MIDIVQKIREEVEKLILRGAYSSQVVMDTRCKEEAYNEVLAILDSLQEEPVSEELEEAANNALNNVLNTHEIVNVGSCLEMFRFGAQWKEKEMQSTIELAEDHAMLVGMNKMKEEMMAKAIDATIGSFTNGIIYDADFDINSDLKDNDKVKVIVIKED